MFRVLIVDDDLLMRQALKVVISGIEKFVVINMVATGEDAVNVCKEEHIDIIFMNILMPGMSGIETSNIIHNDFPDISIYIVSAQAANILLKSDIPRIVKEVIEKPISAKYIRNLLEKYKNEHEGSAKTQLVSLNEIQQNKDYQAMYMSLPKIVAQMHAIAAGDANSLEKNLLNIAQSLLNTTYFYNDENKDINELFPFQGNFILDEKVTELWLFQVMDYLFQKNSINRYPLLANVFEYIEENIREDITLNTIIKRCAISQGYLSRIFREQFQVSVMEYLHIRKIHLAKRYFYFTDQSIAEVAFRLGYNESSYFSKVFKKYENMTVKQYKSGMNKNADAQG